MNVERNEELNELQDDIIQNEKKLNRNMNIAGWIDIVFGILSAIGLLITGGSPILFLFTLLSILLGYCYIYRNRHLKERAWEHLDTLIILAVVNFFAGAFIASIFIILAIRNRSHIKQDELQIES